MAKRINNMNELEKALMPTLKGMVDVMTENMTHHFVGIELHIRKQFPI